MRFFYEYEGFGTSFVGEKEIRTGEIASDVGGRCLRYHGEKSLVIDHHFYRPNNFPSASAAVLHLAPLIYAGLSKCEDVKFITHECPDFDAFCSIYLIRRLLEGGIPADGWEEQGLHKDEWANLDGRNRKINWYDPAVKDLPPDRRAPVLLAAYASMVDQCKPLHCDRSTALHSILYAGFKRGRDWETDGAYAFFRSSEERINQGLNPLFDAIFDETSEYACELAMLRREEVHYRRDIARARCTIVSLPVANAPFDQWFPVVKEHPLFNGSSEVAPAPDHLCEKHKRQQHAGVFLRDPECLLFKEWARADRENSPNGQGFLFTAVAYSSRRPDAKDNKSQYIFSLDPERANGAHLYPVWARLQAAECQLARLENPLPPREGFEGRLAGSPCASDPWYDGSNYQATIIDTPNAGTRLGSLESPDIRADKEGNDTKYHTGVLADLSDDGVAQIILQELEWNMFVAEEELNGAPKLADPSKVVCIRDFPTCGDNIPSGRSLERCAIGSLVSLSNATNALRFASVGLQGGAGGGCSDGVKTQSPQVAASIGKTLWAAIADEGVKTFPDDIISRHLWFDSNSVIIWNRHGIAIASKDRGTISSQMESFEKVAAVIRTAGLIANSSEAEAAFEQGRELLKTVIHLQIATTNPSNIALRRLMEATEINSIVESVAAMNKERFEEEEQKAQEQRDMHLQSILAIGTAFGLLFAWNSMESVSVKALHEKLCHLYPALGFISPDAGCIILAKFIVGILLSFFFAWLFLKNTRGKTRH